MSNMVQMRVELGMGGLPKGHLAYIQAAEEFLHDVQNEPGIAVEENNADRQSSSTKGGVQELLLAPGSAGIALAAVRIMKLWLSRDRRRTIDISITRPGSEPLTVHASGESISLETLENAVRRTMST
jgi:hypothetical protein